ncbi:MAG: SET domain-containing protein-lysine N-methyltransferase [Labilithrix sp.]|nr:SET domain-containing protein-lysine N-methyltransferase [Labilithrix sp.]
MSKKTTKGPTRSRQPLAYRLRRSPVHGTGMFATRAIRKGASIIEYLGERITHDEADRRHAHKAEDDNHTFLFTVDSKTVIDGGAGGNAARFINHSCEPNCEVIIDDGRLFIEALRAIRPGEEIVYDYRITRDSGDPPDVERIFACRCGAPKCRGTMLAPRRKKRAAKRAASSSGRKKTKAAPPTSGRKVKSVPTSGRKAKSAPSSSARKPKSAPLSRGQTTKRAAAPGGQTTKRAAAPGGQTTKRAAAPGGAKKTKGATSLR